mmetsp:Transcript_76706/g.148160  ORF Transcript_76706/g.148160 Transcript_76706/m.148160 type:complete len:621 (+) Transcript_76706:96-1958(+)
MAACISRSIAPDFYHDAAGTSRVTALLLSACAVGFGCSFSAPVGGVIFALEFMLPQTYDFTTYWGCLVASVIGSIVAAVLRSCTTGCIRVLPLISSNLLPGEGTWLSHGILHVACDVVLGAICGLLAGVWIEVQAWTAGVLKRWLRRGTSSSPKSTPGHAQGDREDSGLSSTSVGTEPGGHGDAVRSICLGSKRFEKRSWFAGSGGSIPFRRAMKDVQSAASGISAKMQRSLFRSETLTGKSFEAIRTWTPSFGTYKPSLNPCSGHFMWRDIFLVAMVTCLNSVLSARLPLLHGKSQPALLSMLFDKTLWNNPDEWSLEMVGPVGTLGLCLLFKVVMTTLAMSIPTPTGVVAPAMIMGGLLAHCLVILVPRDFWDMFLTADGGPLSDEVYSAFLARCAIVGACAFSVGVCRTFAMAITVFELMAIPQAVVSLSCACLVSIAVANRVALPFFDRNLVTKGITGVPALTSTDLSLTAVADNVMHEIDLEKDCLPVHSTRSQVLRIMERGKIVVPVIQELPGTKDAILVGSITKINLEKIVDLNSWDDENDTVDLLQLPSKHEASLVNRAPLTVPPNTTMREVYILLRVTGGIFRRQMIAFVTEHGRLVGSVDFEHLLILKHD